MDCYFRSWHSGSVDIIIVLPCQAELLSTDLYPKPFPKISMYFATWSAIADMGCLYVGMVHALWPISNHVAMLRAGYPLCSHRGVVNSPAPPAQLAGVVG